MSGSGFDDRRIRNQERPLLPVVAVWVLASSLLAALTWGRIMNGQPSDPDDVMRLVQVRDLIAGQGWFDLHQYRLAPPEGTLMHWSRLVDIPLFIVIKLLTPFLGQYGAEVTAMIFIPLLTLGACVAMVGMLAWRLTNREVAVFSCLCFVLYPIVMVQMQPMRIDHHGYQILAVLLSMWALSWRNAVRGGAVAGFAMAAGLLVSLELLPLAAAFGGVLFLRWLRDANDRWSLVGYMQSLGASMFVLFLLTRGISDLAPHCDAISPAYLAFFLIAAVGTSILSGFGRLPTLGLVAGFAATGLAGAAFFAVTATQCLGNPFGNLDPLVYENWYLRIREGQPIWVYSWDFALPALVQPLIALFASLALWARHKDWLRRWWLDYSVVLAIAIVGGILTTRSLAFAGALGAIPLGWLLVGLLKEWGGARSIAKRIVYPLVIVALLVPMSIASAVQPHVEALANAGNDVETTKTIFDTGCDLDRSLPALDRLPNGTVFAFFDMGPDILRQTQHSIVASSHHRAGASMKDVILAFSSKPDQARTIIEGHEADYVVICTDLPEARIYSELHPGDAALIDGLKNDEAPEWLQPLQLATPGSFKVWRVVD